MNLHFHLWFFTLGFFFFFFLVLLIIQCYTELGKTNINKYSNDLFILSKNHKNA